MLEAVAEGGRLLLYGAALVVAIGAVAHALGWLLTRRSASAWVWRSWNVVGAVLVAAGVGAIVYGWAGLGLHTGAGSTLVGLGLLLASAGLWMLIPV